MRIALFYFGNPAKEGGTGYVLDCLYRSFELTNHRLYFFNPYYNGRNVFKLKKFKEYRLKEMISLIRNKKKLKVLIYAILKIIFDRKTHFPDRIKMLLYMIIKYNILLNTIDNIIEIFSLIKKLNIDIILGGATTGTIMPLIFILSRFLKKKVCSLTYGNDFLVKTRYSLQTYFIRNLDLIILGTNILKDLIKKIHPLSENQLKVNRYGLILKDYEIKETKDELRREFNIPKQMFVLLSVGRHVSRKNFDLVIKSIQIIKKKKPNIKIRYYLIGEGETTSNLKKLVQKLELENEVHFLGFTTKEKRNKFYKLSDLFIMPSSTEKESIEGFGIVYLEANFFNCPVIGTSSGGIIEAIVDQETGLLVKENNLDDLIEKILYLYNNREKIKELGIKGYQRVINNFDWNLIVNNYIDSFNNLLGRSSNS